MEGSRFILALLLVLCASNVLGHSYLTAPISRSNQRSTNTGCRGPACLGPCDISSSKTTRAPLNIARGASISVQWPRNNHAGGFIRLAWAPTSSSDSHASFDNGVQVIVCHEVGGCAPASKSDPNGGDTGPADGSSQACTTVITVPLHLTDGLWTLQWAWYGGAYALGDYYSCVDYKVSGGPTGSQLAAVFNGGDYTYPGQNKCKFFNTDRLHRCVNEPCNNPVYPGGERSGPAYMGAQVSTTTTTSTTGPRPTTTTTTSTTGPRPTTTTTTSTTGPRPTTTSTTGRLSTTTTTTTSTSGSGGSGTGGPVTTTTGNTVPSDNCASLSNVVSSTKFQVTNVELWGASIRMEVKFDMSETVSNWMVQIIWPEGALDTTISTVYNAGVLKCSANSPIRHSMIAPSSWANPIRAGQSYYVELLASNTNMNKEFLMANVKFRMFKQ